MAASANASLCSSAAHPQLRYRDKDRLSCMGVGPGLDSCYIGPGLRCGALPAGLRYGVRVG
jgi:hypothetical protein